MLIGMTGYAKHGKDASGAVLVEEFGYTRYAFADTLKEMALVLDPYIDALLQDPAAGVFNRLSRVVEERGWESAKESQEVRRFLQVLGTDACRKFLGDDVWVKALEKKLIADEQLHPDEPWISLGCDTVITDVRFPNECGWVGIMGGVMIRVVRLNADGSIYDNGIGADHPSEQHIASLPVDYEIRAHTLLDLKHEVRKVMNQYV